LRNNTISMRSSTNRYFNAVHQVRNPATTALESSGILDLSSCDPDQHEYTSSMVEQQYMGQKETKRSSIISTLMTSTFDLNELVEATKPIQESLGMPLIEWSFLSDDEESLKDDKHQGTIPEDPQDDTTENEDSSSSSILSPLLSYSPSVGKGNHFKRSSHKNRLVRSKALNSHLSMLETSFLSLPRGGCDRLGEPRSATDFPFSYDVERWIELAEHVAAAKAAPVVGPAASQQKHHHQVKTTSLTQQQHTAAVMA
jgi:hypothetical protein